MKKLGMLLALSLVGCADEAKPPGGVVDLEVNEGPPSIGMLVMTNMTFLKDTTAIESLHGAYAVSAGNCIDLQGRAPYEPNTLDVGETVKMVNGSTEIVLDRTVATNGAISYWPAGSNGMQFTVPADKVPANSTWDLVLSGAGAVKAQTWTKKLVIPKLFEVIEPAGLLTDAGFPFSAGAALPVKWKTFNEITDPRDIVIEIYDKNLVPLAACRAEDTGSFDVPANIMTAVADNAAIMAVRIHIYRNQDLNGAEVEVSGGTCDFGPMYKQ